MVLQAKEYSYKFASIPYIGICAKAGAVSGKLWLTIDCATVTVVYKSHVSNLLRKNHQGCIGPTQQIILQEHSYGGQRIIHNTDASTPSKPQSDKEEAPCFLQGPPLFKEI